MAAAILPPFQGLVKVRHTPPMIGKHGLPRFTGLFVVGPQTDDLDGLDVVQHLVHEPVLDGDPARYSAGKVSDKSLVRRGILIGIPRQDFKKTLRLRFEPGTRYLLGVTPGLTGIDKLPSYQSSAS